MYQFCVLLSYDGEIPVVLTTKLYLGKSCWGKEVFRFEFSSIVFAFVIIVQ